VLTIADISNQLPAITIKNILRHTHYNLIGFIIDKNTRLCPVKNKTACKSPKVPTYVLCICATWKTAKISSQMHVIKTAAKNTNKNHRQERHEWKQQL